MSNYTSLCARQEAHEEAMRNDAEFLDGTVDLGESLEAIGYIMLHERILGTIEERLEAADRDKAFERAMRNFVAEAAKLNPYRTL